MQVGKRFFGECLGKLGCYSPGVESTNSVKLHVRMQLLSHLDDFYQWYAIINTNVLIKECKIVNPFVNCSFDFDDGNFGFNRSAAKGGSYLDRVLLQRKCQ